VSPAEEWCAEYVKVRDALKDLVEAIDGREIALTLVALDRARELVAEAEG
jgi:hypothetical protein